MISLVILYIVGFFRTLLFVLAIYFLMRFIIRLLQPHNKTHSSKKSSETKEGETTIRFNKKGDKIVDKDEGEYVDFEEVD
jgi:predicted tellurium resistance membrane protein TerC